MGSDVNLLVVNVWKSAGIIQKLNDLKMVTDSSSLHLPMSLIKNHGSKSLMAIPTLSQSMATTTIPWTNTPSQSSLSMTHTKATTPQITLLLISLGLLRKLNEIQCLLLQMLAVEPLDTIQRIHHAVVVISSPMTHCAVRT